MIIIRGKVRKGQKRGRQLGFPTANIRLHKRIPEGIYISQTTINTVLYPSVTFIGKAKTFSDSTYQAEVYILDFNKNIYATWVTNRLIKKIRDNQKFDSIDDLITQMKKDTQITKKYFNLS